MNLIFTVLAVLGFIVVFIWRGMVRRDSTLDKSATYRFKFNKSQALAILPLLLLLTNFITVIPANTVGIVYSPFEGTSTTTLSEGVHVKGPFDVVYQINTQVRTTRLESITGQTKDSQYVDITLDIQYKVDSSSAFNVFRNFQTLDNLAASYIPNAVQRAVEEVTTGYNVYDILGSEKPVVYREIELLLASSLAEQGVQFYSINFIDADAGEAIETAIRDQAVAAQRVETATQEREAARISAQQQIDMAQAEQDAATIQAETLVIEAQAQAEAYRILSESITDEILRQQYIEALSNWRPVIIGDPGQYMIQLPDDTFAPLPDEVAETLQQAA